MQVLRISLVLAVCRLPARIRSRLLRSLFGWHIHPSARIGISILGVRYLEMERNSSIGHGNVVRDMERLSLGMNSVIDQWNWISSSSLLVSHFRGGAGHFRLGANSALTSRHYVDGSGGVSIGDFTTVAGVKSTILTHQIDLETSEQYVDSVVIGDYCFLGSDCRVVAGSTILSNVIVAMGAVVAGNLSEPYSLYGGIPAKFIKRVDGAKYFSRQSGWVGPTAASPTGTLNV
jgi:acetyltransferase-like isoleucine patch superfamily enzyme